MAVIVCKICGGTLVRSGSFDVCEYCGNKWEIDRSNEIQAVDRANAWASLRDGDFEKAARQFEEILLKEPDNHEAYWGRALAANGIIYVTDLLENKKVPTCNNITENSFLDHADVKKAISLAPLDIQGTYEAQAKQIEQIRVEWLEKAAKEPAYDVFLSYKDSDREKGIERTQDSIDAQDLYNALTAEGYKVFFSRISLRDKISEQYEPYIYNAIKTAKVMIVFGEKPEYFHSVWIKNEWSRFVTRIRNGEKHKNSLVVVYKNLNPGDLPVVLKSRQCLNAGDITFFSDLNRHIKRVLELSTKTAQIEKIKIEGGKVGKKATTLKTNIIQIREIGQGAIAQTDINEQQNLDLLQSYFNAHKWESAVKLADDILFDNPDCTEAVYYKLLAEHKTPTVKDLLYNMSSLDTAVFATVEKILDCASETFAETFLEQLYQHAHETNKEAGEQLLQTILPYNCKNRDKWIKGCFDQVIQAGNYKLFTVLLTTLDAADVDAYIQYHWTFANSDVSKQETCSCLEKILEVDEGHQGALEKLMVMELERCNSAKVKKASGDVLKNKCERLDLRLENYLKFSSDTDAAVVRCLDWLTEHADSSVHYTFARKLLQYYSQDLACIKEQITGLKNRMIAVGAHEEAEYYIKLLLEKNPNDSQLYWDICLIQAGVKSEKDLVNSPVLLKDIPEYKKYLTMVPEDRRRKCFSLEERQVEARCNALWEICRKKSKPLFTQGNYDSRAISEFNGIIPYTKFRDMEEFKTLMKIAPEGKKAFYEKVDDLPILRKKLQTVRNHLSSGSNIFGVKSDGTVVSTGRYREISEWTDIVAVSTVDERAVGLKSDGTVVATEYTGVDWDYAGQCDVRSWRDIVAISAGSKHTVGLKKDGTVVATKFPKEYPGDYYGQCDVESWRDIVQISAGRVHTIGLKADGTAVATGRLGSRSCSVGQWTHLVEISAGLSHTVGLKTDGTVVATGSNIFGECNVSRWKNIVAISAGPHHTVGLKADGTVVATDFLAHDPNMYHNECDVGGWADIVAISAGSHITVGLKKDGTVVTTRDWGYYKLDYLRNELNGWKLFQSINTLEKEKIVYRKKQEAAEAERQHRRSLKLCQHCGGEFKGLFSKKCTGCGKSKDY